MKHMTHTISNGWYDFRYYLKVAQWDDYFIAAVIAVAAPVSVAGVLYGLWFVITHISLDTVCVLAICLEWLVRGINVPLALWGFKKWRGGE